MSLATFIADSYARSSWRARPRSFVALMGLYESNYTRLGWLVDDIRLLDGASRSVVPGDCDLVLTVTDRGPYTATFTLTYDLGDSTASPADYLPASACQPSEPEAPFTIPDMAVRVYHDARVAEAQGWAPAHDHAALQRFRNGLDRELDQRWARNTMLNKWLEYCAERGHRFRQVKAIP